MNKGRLLITVFITLGALALSSWILTVSERPRTPAPQPESFSQTTSTMVISSPAFKDREAIPVKYTCDGENVNPGFSIADLPVGTKSLALIMDDPDAPGGTFTHWLVWNIDPTIEQIPEAEGDSVGVLGVTSRGKPGYVGPCPPPGNPHRYYFTFYALDVVLNLPDAADRPLLEEAIEEHQLDRGVYMGTYARAKN
jgi:Raf kinase inhibitor-like YbhB/YbcL family protein